MKNKKKAFYKNRVKCYYTESTEYGKNRLKMDDHNKSLNDHREKEEKDNYDLHNSEEEGDVS